jgi:toxin HigB-1
MTDCVNNHFRYAYSMILSFKSKETEALFRFERVRKWIAIERAALRKLMQLELAATLSDLRFPPGNRLEALSGDRFGALEYSHQ